jgi:hypothetical protein
MNSEFDEVLREFALYLKLTDIDQIKSKNLDFELRNKVVQYAQKHKEHAISLLDQIKNTQIKSKNFFDNVIASISGEPCFEDLSFGSRQQFKIWYNENLLKSNIINIEKIVYDRYYEMTLDVQDTSLSIETPDVRLIPHHFASHPRLYFVLIFDLIDSKQ